MFLNLLYIASKFGLERNFTFLSSLLFLMSIYFNTLNSFYPRVLNNYLMGSENIIDFVVKFGLFIG